MHAEDIHIFIDTNVDQYECQNTFKKNALSVTYKNRSYTGMRRAREPSIPLASDACTHATCSS
jgi:hypothetical protein